MTDRVDAAMDAVQQTFCVRRTITLLCRPAVTSCANETTPCCSDASRAIAASREACDFALGRLRGQPPADELDQAGQALANVLESSLLEGGHYLV